MTKLLFSLISLFLFATSAMAATIYIDGSLGADCTNGTYHVVNRTCNAGGSSGNAYNDTLAATNASAVNDTIYFRSGSITVNNACHGIELKNGQTWAQYPGDPVRSTTVTAAAGCAQVFRQSSANNGTVQNLTIVGGRQTGIRAFDSVGFRAIGNDICCYNIDAAEGGAGVNFSSPASNGEARDNIIHNPTADNDNAGISIGGSGTSNILVTGNRITGTRFGVWLDVNACWPGGGFTPCTITNNYIKTPTRYCFLAEIGSTATWQNNICDTPGTLGIYLNTRDVANNGSKIQNNTFYKPGEAGIWIGAGGGGGAPQPVTNLLVENNIIYDTAATFPNLSVDQQYISNTTNRYRNNLIFSPSHNQGICWGDATAGTSAGCDIPPATQYADSSAGISSWQSATSGVASGNIASDPLFANPAGEDFRLCTAAGVPHASCTGRSPAIDAGLNIGLPFTGSAPDIGALETSGSTTPGLYADGGTLGGCTNGNKTYNPATRTCGSGTDTVYVGTTTTVTISAPVGTPPLVYLGPPIAGTYTRNTALQLAINASAAGDTIYVRNFGPSNLGVYWGTNSALQNFIVPKAGLSVSQRSTIEGYQSERPLIQGISAPDDNGVSFIHIKNLIIDGASAPNMSNTVTGVLDSRFENSTIRNSGGHGALFVNNTEFINVTSHSHGYRAHLSTPGCLGFACWCGLNDHTCHGIYFTTNVTFDGGEWYDISGYGIHCSDSSGTVGCNGNTVKNVRVHHNSSTGVYLGFPGPGPGGNSISNVVTDHNGGNGIAVSGVTAIYNVTSLNNVAEGICASNYTTSIIRNVIALGNGNTGQIMFAPNCINDTTGGAVMSNTITTGTASSLFIDLAGLPGQKISCDYACAQAYLGLRSTATTAVNQGTRWIRSTTAPTPPPTCPGGSSTSGTPVIILPADADGSCPEIGAYAFGVGPPVNAPPVVTITTNGGNPISTPNATAQTLTADCKDDVACVSATWTSNRYGANDTCSGTSTLTCTAIPVPVGESIITITALDGSGATGTDTIAITYTPTHPGDSIVLAMGFSENTGTSTADSSGNNNMGTLAGGATWTSSGKYGSGIRFDGTSGSVNVSGVLNNSLNLTQGLTIEAWVFPETGGSGYQVILQKNAAGIVASAPYFLIGVSGICGSNVPDGGIIVNDDGTPRNACASPPLIQNIWTHLALTYDGKVLTLYKDGVSVQTLAQTGLMVPTTGNLTIGRAGADGFRGVLDEIRIANYARSEAQIKADMIEPVTAPVPPTAVKISSGSIRKFASGTTQKMTQ